MNFDKKGKSLPEDFPFLLRIVYMEMNVRYGCKIINEDETEYVNNSVPMTCYEELKLSYLKRS